MVGPPKEVSDFALYIKTSNQFPHFIFRLGSHNKLIWNLVRGKKSCSRSHRVGT